MAEKTKEVQAYLQKTQANEVVQQALNQLLETMPEDPYGALSLIFAKKAAAPTISRVVGREVLDSRGNPTVEVDVYATQGGVEKFAGRSSAPSGASTGTGEARELRDGDKKRYLGKGTLKASGNVKEFVEPAVKGSTFADLRALDKKICEADGTELKEKIGGNATTAASFALATAATHLEGTELFLYLARQYHKEMPKTFTLPTPFFNILNGGKHAGGNLKIQEFMIAPNNATPFPEQLRMAAEVYHNLGAMLVAEHGPSARNLGDEGGYAPLINTPREALDVIERAIKKAGYEPGKDIFIGLDAAASEFYTAETGTYEVEVGVVKTGAEMVAYWADLVKEHPAIISIEDGLDEKDYANWILLTKELGDKIQLVGDDLYTTNPKTIKQGLEGKWCNALLLKVNQIGSISEAMDAAKLVHDAKQNVMVSHRSGETCNSLISDLAVAIGAKYIKTGSCARGERIEKYTRLLQIYEYLEQHKMLGQKH